MQKLAIIGYCFRTAKLIAVSDKGSSLNGWDRVFPSLGGLAPLWRSARLDIIAIPPPQVVDKAPEALGDPDRQRSIEPPFTCLCPNAAK